MALEPLLAGRRTWPSRREFEQAGLGGMYQAIRHGEDHPALAAATGWRCSARGVTARRRVDAPELKRGCRALARNTTD